MSLGSLELVTDYGASPRSATPGAKLALHGPGSRSSALSEATAGRSINARRVTGANTLFSSSIRL